MTGFKKTAKQAVATALLGAKAIYCLLFGGSRSGKTALFIFALIVRSLKCNSRHLILRKHLTAVKISIGYDTMPKVLAFMGLTASVSLNKEHWFWTFPNGSEIWLAGLDDKERTEKVLGREFSTILFEEASEMAYESVETALTRLAQKTELTNRAYYSCNPPSKGHWLYKLFILLLNPESGAGLPNPDLYASMLMNPYNNEENLPENYIRDILGNLSERKRQRFLEGKWLDDVEGALWNINMLAAYRIKPSRLPQLQRIVVGVDPAVTSTEKSDETGIVAVGMDDIGHYYVLEDRSLKGTPLEWARAVTACYLKNNADRVIGEVNNGGDLVEMNLRSIDASISYKSVHASRGKHIRAEPVAALYEQGRVHHVGEFPDLEDEMISWTPESTVSPNHMDALVWAISELGITTVPHVYTDAGKEEQSFEEQKIEGEIQKLLDDMTPEDRIEAERIMRENKL